MSARSGFGQVIGLAAWLASAAPVAAACSTGWSTQERWTGAGLMPIDAVSVILESTPTREFSPQLEKKIATCVRDALLNSHPTIRTIPADDVRKRAFGEPAPDQLPN